MEGISIKAIELIIAILGLSLLLVAYGSATTHGNEGQSSNGHPDGIVNNYAQSWNHNGYDWLSTGGYYGYPTTYYYNWDWYYKPYYPNIYYPIYHYTEPVYNMPVVYHNWGMNLWWGANVYGFGSTGTYYSSGFHWTYNSGFGVGDS